MPCHTLARLSQNIFHGKLVPQSSHYLWPTHTFDEVCGFMINTITTFILWDSSFTLFFFFFAFNTCLLFFKMKSQVKVITIVSLLQNKHV